MDQTKQMICLAAFWLWDDVPVVMKGSERGMDNKGKEG